MPAANHSFYLRNCYLENNISRGRATIAGRRIDLSKVTVPVYNLATKEDHIAPAKSVFIGSHFLGGPVRFVLTASGHIAGVVNPPARRKYQYWTGGPPNGSLEDWLQGGAGASGLLVGRLARVARSPGRQAHQEEAPAGREQAEAARGRTRHVRNGAKLRHLTRFRSARLPMSVFEKPRSGVSGWWKPNIEITSDPALALAGL